MEHVKLREKIGYGLGDAASSMFWKLFTMYCYFSIPTWWESRQR